jgi:hypothetical protein
MRQQWWRRGWLGVALACLVGVSGCSLGSGSGAGNVGPTPTASTYSLPGGGACVQLGAHPQAPYLNVRVSHDSFLAHSEPMVVENPKNPLNLVGGSKFFTDPKHYQFKIGWYASFDGGCTWNDGGILPGYANERLTSDISFAFGPQNHVYATVLDEAGRESGIGVSTSDDGGKTFAPRVQAFDNTNFTVFSDKPWMAVDTTGGVNNGNIYVVWSYDYESVHGQLCNSPTISCAQEVGFMRSTDGGKTFSRVKLIEGSASFCTNPAQYRAPGSHLCDAALGATPVVLPDGTLAVMYAYIDLANGTIPTRILVVTSHDGGATWSPPVQVTRIHDIPPNFSGENFRTAPLPAFAADPKTGQMYVAWSNETAGESDILLATSSDEGKTWSAPVKVNNDPTGQGVNHFQQQLAVAPDGVVSVAYFATLADPAHRLIDTYLAQSVDHGQTFLPAVRVTTQSWDSRVDEPFDGFGEGFIGDYQGLAADNQFVHPFWNDTRTGSQEIFTAAVPSAQP